MKIREFESKEALITVVTEDYEVFSVYEERYLENYKVAPKVKIGEFISKDIDGRINSEKTFSDFLQNRFNITDVYSVNDFREV